MQFRLNYRGKLKGGNSKDRGHIHDIRLVFHDQLKTLWNQKPLNDEFKHWLDGAINIDPRRGNRDQLLKKIGENSFLPLINSHFHLLAKLDFLILRPAAPGQLFNDGGDLDNRIKTIIDSLRIPQEGEVPKNWKQEDDKTPTICLLEDDKLITDFSVSADRLLDPAAGHQDVLAIIKVKIGASKIVLGNMGLAF